ncbi:MAG TPA: DUF1223 domain-containing protein [Polyangia bacterium]
MRSRTLKLLLVMFASAGCHTRAIAAPPAWRRVVLVELFTSQGCSSCPPADAFLRELPALGLGRDKVVPLAFHVNYWDGLGWKDPFATAAFTERQRTYARSGTLRSPDGASGIDGLYTPQMIVDGRVHFSGQRRQDALREIELAAMRAPAFDLVASGTIHGSTIDVVVTGLDRGHANSDASWRVVVALAATRTRTPVARGENAGETLDEAAVVRALSESMPLARAAQRPITLRLDKPADLPWSSTEIVVFVQSERTGDVGAASVLDPKQLTTR